MVTNHPEPGGFGIFVAGHGWKAKRGLAIKHEFVHALDAVGLKGDSTVDEFGGNDRWPPRTDDIKVFWGYDRNSYDTVPSSLEDFILFIFGFALAPAGVDRLKAKGAPPGSHDFGKEVLGKVP
jgi:hypothetical protein